jgi:transposase
MEVILDVYKRQYCENYPVICMDETPKQLIEEIRIPIDFCSGQPTKYDYEYRRNGMSNIFIATEPLTGKRVVKVTGTKTKRDWAYFMKKIADKYCKAETITIVLDNYGTHSIGAFYEVFSPEDARALVEKFQFIYTPKHGSWLNMAEIELSIMQRQCINRRIGNINTLNEEIVAWADERNSKNNQIDWQFTTKDSRIKLKRLYPSIDG